MPDPDDDREALAALAIVAVDVGDEPTAPSGCAALRELRSRPLLHWAVTALTASGAVRRVVVAAPPELAAGVRSAVAGVSADVVGVVPAPRDGPGARILAALRAAPAAADDEIVVVHDPLYPLSPAHLARAVTRRLAGAPDAVAAVPERPVTDTLKWLDGDDVVLGTADRELHRLVGSPQAYRRPALLAALRAADDADLRGHLTHVLPHLAAANGGRVAFVPFPGESFRVVTEDDRLLAGALVAAQLTSGRVDTRPATAPRRPGRAGT